MLRPASLLFLIVILFNSCKKEEASIEKKETDSTIVSVVPPADYRNRLPGTFTCTEVIHDYIQISAILSTRSTTLSLNSIVEVQKTGVDRLIVITNHGTFDAGMYFFNWYRSEIEPDEPNEIQYPTPNEI